MAQDDRSLQLNLTGSTSLLRSNQYICPKGFLPGSVLANFPLVDRSMGERRTAWHLGLS
jgi:hypothetical protein